MSNSDGVRHQTKSEIERGEQKPVALPVNPDGIPEELKAIPQWVCWSYERRCDSKGVWKWTKPPINARTDRRAKSTDPSTSSTFDEALARYRTSGLDGI